jgi:hypothetical protein
MVPLSAIMLIVAAHSLNRNVIPLTTALRISSVSSRSLSIVRLSSFATTDSSSSPAPSDFVGGDAAAISTTTETLASSASTQPVPVEDAYEKVSMDDIVSLCKRRGFIFPSSEIYNGFAGFYDYGPLGAVTRRDDVVGIDSSIIHNPTTWKSSGDLTVDY